MPSAFNILKTDHTGFCVNSLEEALPFWTDALGYELLRRGDIEGGDFLKQVAQISPHNLRFALLSGYGHQIELLEYYGAERAAVPPNVEAVGAAHLCFKVDDLDAMLEAVKRYGYIQAGEPQVLSTGPRAGTRVVFITNSDQIHLELMQPDN